MIKVYRLFLISVITLGLTGCPGGSGDGDSTPPVDNTAPTVSFSPATLSVEAGMTASSTLSSSDNVMVTSGPTVSCSNGGAFDVASNTFTAPMVTSNAESICTATASDAAGNQGSATLTVTITVSTATDTTEPGLSFSPQTLSVIAGMTGASVLSVTDDVGVVSGPDVLCTNGGVFDVASNTFTAAMVLSNTESVCTATASDAAGNQGTATLSVTMTPPPDVTAPNLSFSPPTLSVESGMTGSAMLLVSDDVGIASGPMVSCTNAGMFDIASDTFTAPTVMSQTESVCTATASDAAANQGSATLTVTITPQISSGDVCPRTLPTVTSGTCDITEGTGTATLLQGDLLYASGLKENAEVLIDDGEIICTGCDCSGEAQFETATKLMCTDAVISPGLINGRESVTFGYSNPFNNTERYQQRHDWRTGARGFTRLSIDFPGAGSNQVRWSEIRSVMGGVTSSVGSGSVDGMLRNLDRDSFVAAVLPENVADFEVTLGPNGINQDAVEIDTFPLGDSDGTQISQGCAYDELPSDLTTGIRREPILASDLELTFFGEPLELVIPEDTVLGAIPLVLTLAEGIDAVARNEFLCLSGIGEGSVDFLGQATAIVSGAGLTADDINMTVPLGTGLVWTPRSDTSLYGNTALAPVFKQAGGLVGLATSFIPSGSPHMGRELACAADWNERWGGEIFSEVDIVNLATLNNATLAGYGNSIGEIAVGKIADITVWSTANRDGVDAVINAENTDVALVMLGGVPLYGEDDLVQTLVPADNCEQVDVCGESRRLCATREYGIDLSEIIAEAPEGASPLFACDAWPNEPTCLPSRTTPDAYTGIASANDLDGDGVDDGVDNCVGVFNPPTPLNPGVQADSDGDGVGDLCDQ